MELSEPIGFLVSCPYNLSYEAYVPLCRVNPLTYLSIFRTVISARVSRFPAKYLVSADR